MTKLFSWLKSSKCLSKLCTKFHITTLNLKMEEHFNPHTLTVDYTAVQYFNAFFIELYSLFEGKVTGTQNFPFKFFNEFGTWQRSKLSRPFKLKKKSLTLKFFGIMVKSQRN